MASSGKKKTTMAKLARESRLRERRLAKQAKKDARRQGPAQDQDVSGDALTTTTGEATQPSDEQPAVEAVVGNSPTPDDAHFTAEEARTAT